MIRRRYFELIFLPFLCVVSLFFAGCKSNANTRSVTRVSYPSGEVRFEIPYLGNQRDGLVKEYYKSGNLFAIIPYQNGKKSGKAQTFFESGELRSEGNFVNGALAGK